MRDTANVYKWEKNRSLKMQDLQLSKQWSLNIIIVYFLLSQFWQDVLIAKEPPNNLSNIC